jgi:hypothetical protein
MGFDGPLFAFSLFTPTIIKEVGGFRVLSAYSELIGGSTSTVRCIYTTLVL